MGEALHLAKIGPGRFLTTSELSTQNGGRVFLTDRGPVGKATTTYTEDGRDLRMAP